MRRLLVQKLPILLFLILLAAFPLGQVSAHAMLVSAKPGSNDSLPSAPPQVELIFSEAVDQGLSSIRVLDSNGSQVDLRDLQVDPDNPARLTVSLRSLVDGVYTVTWKAVSAADGHLTGGTFPFAIGNVDAAALAAAKPASTTSLPFSGLASKWLFYLALAVLAGRTTFLRFVWRPAVARSGSGNAGSAPEAAWGRLSQVSLIALFFAFGWGLLSQAGQAAGAELAAPWSIQAGDLLAGSRLGLVWWLRLVLGLALVGVMDPFRLPSAQRAWRDWLALSLCLGLVLTASLVSHSAADPQPFLPVLADFTHLAAVSAWVGGLAWFVLGVMALRRLPSGEQAGLVSALILRFSAMAAVCVGLVSATGVYTSFLRIGALNELFTTLYGQALLLKVGLALVLMLLGGVNLVGISPRLRRETTQRENDPASEPARSGLVRLFRRVVSAEVGLSVAVLLSASLLTSLPPAQSVQSGGGLSGSARADDLDLRLSITPGRVGQNTFVLRVFKNGQPVVAVKEALLRMGPRKTNIPPTEAQLVAQGDGSYVAHGSYLSLPDTWQVQAIVRRDQQYDAYAIFNFDLRNPANPGQAQAEMIRLAGALAALCGLAGAFAIWVLLAGWPSIAKPKIAGSSVRWIGRGAASGLPALLLVGMGLMSVFNTPTPVVDQLNPISPSAKSIAAGQTIYAARCAACHGVTGKGDGPIGQTLIPPPADLTQHAVPGVHTDFQLYQWISDGFPGGRMPGFKGVLSPEDRWNLINFIRTMAAK